MQVKKITLNILVFIILYIASFFVGFFNQDWQTLGYFILWYYLVFPILSLYEGYSITKKTNPKLGIAMVIIISILYFIHPSLLNIILKWQVTDHELIFFIAYIIIGCLGVLIATIITKNQQSK